MRFGRKIALLILALVAITGLLLSGIYGYFMNQRLEQVSFESVKMLSHTLANSLAGQIINHQSSQVQLVLNELVKEHKEFEYAYVIDFEGRVFAYTFDKGFPAKLLNLSVGDDLSDAHVNIDGKIFKHYSIPIIEGMEASLHLGQNQAANTALMRDVIGKMLAVVAVLALLGIFVAYASARRIAGPIERIAEQLVNYIRGDEPKELELENDTYEIRRLVDAYNSLVNERRTIQSALTNSEARFEKLTRTSPVGVFQTDADGHCLYVNPAWCEITGLSLSEALHDGWASALHPDDRERVFNEWTSAAGKNEKFESEYRFVKKDKQEVWVYGQSNAEFDDDARLLGYAGSITDITEQKQNNLALQAERNFIDAVLDTANALVVVLDRQGRIIRFNRACEETTLYDFAEVKEKYIWEILLTAEQVEPVKAVFNDLKSNALPNEFSNYWLAKDKSKRLIRWSNTVLTDANGEVSHTISIGIDMTEQQYVDNALRDAQALNEQIINSSPIGIAIYKENGQCIAANQAVADIIGATREQILAQNYNNIPAWQKSGLLDKAQQAIRDQCSVYGELDVVTSFGKSVSVEYYHVPFIRNDKQHLLFMTADITARKETENKLLLTSRAVDTATNAIAMARLDATLTYVNQSFLDMWGYKTEAEVLGLPAMDLWRDPSVVNEMVMQLTGHGHWMGEMVATRQDGEEFTASLSANVTVDNNGQPVSLMASFIDVSQEKAIKEELQRNQETLAKAQEIAHIGSWDWDIHTGELKWSDEIYRIFGQEPNAFPATYEAFVETIHPDDRQYVIDAVNNSVEQVDHPYSVEHRVVRPNGEQRIVHEQGLVYRDNKGNAMRMIGAVLDITEQKQAETEILNLNKELENRVSKRTTELQESLKLLSKENEERKCAELSLVEAKEEAERANQLKSEFLGRMSHELRTPMNAILGFSQLLETENLSESQADSVKEISLAGNHLLGLINEVLDLSSIEAGKFNLEFENCVLNDLVMDCVTMVQPMAMDKNILIDNRIETSENMLLHVDPLRFKEVLVNLLGNAVKYNSTNGHIIINSQIVNKGAIRINVIDDGPGMTIEQQALVFEPFNRLGAEYSDIEGTGIGLTIAKKLISLMHGQIGVQSIHGQGSTFWIEYSLMEGARAAETTGKQQGVAAMANPIFKQSVLYVEDNPANLRLVQRVFERLKNVVLYSAPNAELGIELAKSKQPDLILLDINLPGMNGYEALSRLRNLEATSRIPVIAVSAAAMPRDIERGHAAGFRRYITKPIQIVDLIEAIKGELEQCRDRPIASA